MTAAEIIAADAERRALIVSLIDLGTDTPTTAHCLDRLTLAELRERLALLRGQIHDAQIARARKARP